MKPLERIIEAARRAPRRIVLSEGEDPRVAEAAIQASRDGIADIVLVGNRAVVADRLAGLGADASRFAIEDPETSPLTPRLAAAYRDLWEARNARKRASLKGEASPAALSGQAGQAPEAGAAAAEAEAEAAVRSPLVFAAMMVREGAAHGTIGGAVATTAETVRVALQIIGPAPGVGLVSSFFLMMLCEPHHAKKGAFVFADCGLCIDPDAAALADIAVTSARSCEALTGERARVAMLSFSTGGSATHERVSKVVEATALARAAAPDLMIDGELQFDAAFVEAVSTAKAPGSVLRGHANVFVFPNLDAANIGYKIAQQIGAAQAIGPILQGLRKPANDLSRACKTKDIYNLIAITNIQTIK